jgi:hypothetical protein
MLDEKLTFRTPEKLILRNILPAESGYPQIWARRIGSSPDPSLSERSGARPRTFGRRKLALSLNSNGSLFLTAAFF